MAVQAAMIVMTILGCDDSVSQCHYISTVSGTWQTVAICDAESQKQLPKFSNSNYPVVVAMCEPSGHEITAIVDPDAGAPAAKPMEQTPPAMSAQTPAAPAQTAPAASTTSAAADVKKGLPSRALELVTGVLPNRARLREVVEKPVHYIEGSYSWVARKFAD